MVPSISIIVPCYMQSAFLSDALTSVLVQSHVDWECIIVNDGSRDDTELVANDWTSRDNRFVYIWKENGGLPSARNTGIEAARGERVLFLDADDRLDPHALENLERAMQHEKVDMVLGGWLRFSSESLGWFDLTGPVQIDDPIHTWLNCNPTPVHAVLLSRKALNAVGPFDDRLTACEDWDLWLRLSLLGIRVASIPQVVAHYRSNPVSMSSSRDRMLKNRVMVFTKACETIFKREEMAEGYYMEIEWIAIRLIRRLYLSNVVDRIELMRQLRGVVSISRQFELASKARGSTKLSKSLNCLAGTYADALVIRLLKKSKYKDLCIGFT